MPEPRELVSIGVELAGIGCVVAAAWWFMALVGLLVTGVALIYVAQGLSK